MPTRQRKLSCFLLTGLVALGIMACSDQTPTKSAPLTYSPIGPTLDRSFRVSNLYISNGNAYLPIAGRTDGPLRYAQLSVGAPSGTPYKIVDLLIPMDAHYKLVGSLFVDTTTERMYAPVVIADGLTNTYTWLTYDAKGLTPIGTPLGNYPVPSNPELQFGVSPPGLYKGVIYPNYAGNLVGISTATRQQVFQKNGVLAPTQRNYAVIENQILTFRQDNTSMVLIDMTNGTQKNVGGNLNALADEGYQAMPFFAVYNGTVYLLTVGSRFKLGLCTASFQADQGWQCKSSDMPLPDGAQITAFNVDMASGTLYFLTSGSMNGTQLNRIIQ